MTLWKLLFEDVDRNFFLFYVEMIEIRVCSFIEHVEGVYYYNHYYLVFPPVPKKGMVRLLKRALFNARQHVKRALLARDWGMQGHTWMRLF